MKSTPIILEVTHPSVKFLPSVNTTAGKCLLLFHGTKLWNAIPVDIKQYPHHKFVKYGTIRII